MPVREPTGGWGSWFTGWWVYRSNQPVYNSVILNATDFLDRNPEKFQFRVGVIEAPEWPNCDLTDATPAPLFDNLFVMKYRLQGPLVSFPFGSMSSNAPVEDGFPSDGSLEGSIRWDPNYGAVLAGQDSRGWPIYTFAVEGQPAYFEDGLRRPDSFYFDLPDGPAQTEFTHLGDEDPLFYRGDVIHYYFETTDDAGGLTHFPADTSGLLDFEPPFPYDPYFTVRGLPNGNASTRPKILVWDQDRSRSGSNRLTLSQAGLVEGVDYDYKTGYWIALRYGLSLEQISGYETILANDAGVGADELNLLMQWFGQEGTRRIIWTGRNRARNLAQEGAGVGIDFLNNILGVAYLAPSIRDVVGGQYSPDVAPVHDTCFSTSLNLNADCPILEEFNHIQPTAGGAEISHEFVDRSGNSYLPSIAAAVVWRREEMGASKSTAFFPMRLGDIWDLRSGDTTIDGTSARSRVLRELFECMGVNPGPPIGTGVEDLPLRFSIQQNFPNPFNPLTEISYSLARAVPVELLIYDSAGRAVRTLVHEPQPAGRYGVRWDSTDDSGHRVASGIYHYRLKAGRFEETRKMVLLR